MSCEAPLSPLGAAKSKRRRTTPHPTGVPMHTSTLPSLPLSLLATRCRAPLLAEPAFLRPRHGCSCTHPLRIWMCHMAQRPRTLLVLFGPLEELHYLDRVIMNTVSVVVGARTTRTSSCEHEKGAQSLQVSAHVHTWSLSNRSVAPSPTCHRS